MARSLWFPLACALLLTGCAQPGENVAPPADGGDAARSVAWREHEHLGRILVDGEGRTLYVFTRDPPGASACAGECAATWPPLPAANASDADLAARLTTIAREDGTQQAAIDGRPLYRSAADHASGEANGQGRNGAWFVVRETDTPGQLNVDFLDGPGEHEVEAGNVSYAPGIQGYLAAPTGNGSHPGVVMIHEWWGLNDHVRKMARALASHGYAVLAVDLFRGSVATTPQEAMAQVGALSQPEATANMRAAAAHLRERAGASSVSSLGWCFGGGQSLRLALSGEPLAATVIYYGTLDTDAANLSAIEWPVLGIFGAEDDSIPVERVRAFEDALASAGVEAEIHIYDGVGHAFANPSGDAYAAKESMDAWSKTLAFLARTAGAAG